MFHDFISPVPKDKMPMLGKQIVMKICSLLLIAIAADIITA
jgi:hypothetical protein